MSSDSLIVRSATSADAPAIASVQVVSWQQAYAGLIPAQYLAALQSSISRREAFWCESIAAGRTHLSLVCVNQQVIGFIAIGPCRDEGASAGEMGEVTALYLLPRYWRTGAGRALWAAGLRRLVEYRYRRAMLWVLSENARARRFYDQAGWSPEPDSERSLLIGGASLREIRYRSPALS
ncbi:GNAT family N-acetyltransferase [Pseudomonas sp. CNPSo 3701]|uniref:GNAT family N-acetyltransferase n=1 Tax=Pseudomonas sp. CNPSo 3701 TaxID=3027943 RepID=UPI0023649C8E|nr:GNAT family N-acetyltransferase [Pseudomonas sp. CNPSo 3701]MDD1509111.1 GNAT family N-acetyltransferase [Pseudomonas sp. CNPSo 3701]